MLKMKIGKIISGAFNWTRAAYGICRDTASGKYTGVDKWSIIAMAAMVMYLISPIDIIPDILPGLGELDDISTVVLCFKILNSEIAKYKLWRKTEEQTIDICAR